MNKVLVVVLTMSIIANVILGALILRKARAEEGTGRDSIREEIRVIEARSDSIMYVVDTIVVRIRENKENYEKARDAIGANRVDDDYLFFEGYLASRFDSLDNE